MPKKKEEYSIRSDFKGEDDLETGELVVDLSKEKPEVTGYIETDVGDDLNWPGAVDEDDESVLSHVREEDEVDELGDEETEIVTLESRRAEEEAEAGKGKDDDSEYSKSVRKRIARERAVTSRERDRANRLEQRLDRIERKLTSTKDDAEFETLKTETTSKLTDLRSQKLKAMEEGESEKVIEIDDKILDLKTELKAKELMRKEVEDVVDDTTSEVKDTMPPKAQEWIDLHPEYESDPKFRRAVLGADRIVNAEGYNINTDEYYQEISKILAKRFPDYIDEEDLGEEKPQRRKTRRSPTTGVSRGGTQVSSKVNLRKGRVTLTPKDRRQMLRFGLNPNSKEDVAAFARERLVTLREAELEG